MENLFKSLSLMALSCETRSLLRSEYLIFSKFANCRNESSTSVSTFAVAEELAIGTLFGTDGRRLAVITSLLSFATSFGPSTGVASAPFAICESCFVRFIVSDVRSRKPLSGRAICEEMIAGSTGVLAKLDLLVGSRRAGGMYLLVWLVCSGG